MGGGRLARRQLGQQLLGRQRDPAHRLLEGGLGAVRGLLHAAHLAHVLARGGLDLLVGGGGLEPSQRGDVPAHAARLTTPSWTRFRPPTRCRSSPSSPTVSPCSGRRTPPLRWSHPHGWPGSASGWACATTTRSKPTSPGGRSWCLLTPAHAVLFPRDHTQVEPLWRDVTALAPWSPWACRASRSSATCSRTPPSPPTRWWCSIACRDARSTSWWSRCPSRSSAISSPSSDAWPPAGTRST